MRQLVEAVTQRAHWTEVGDPQLLDDAIGDANRLRRVDIERGLPRPAAGAERDMTVIPRTVVVLGIPGEALQDTDGDAVVGKRHGDAPVLWTGFAAFI